MSIKYFRCVIIQLLNKFAVSAMVLRRWDLTVVAKKTPDPRNVRLFVMTGKTWTVLSG